MHLHQYNSRDSIKKSVTAILLNLSEEIDKYGQPAVIDDAEVLHDFRVAIRRTRSLLSEFKSLFIKTKARYFREEFLWVFDQTGKVRDIDVHLNNLYANGEILPDCHKYDILVLKAYLLAEQDAAYKDLQNLLISERYQKLIFDWQTCLRKKQIVRRKYAKETACHFTRQHVSALQEVISEQSLLAISNAPDELLHDLRKNCKKLRYLLEFFTDCFRLDEINQVLQILKNLQDNLGCHQDLCVQIQILSNIHIVRRTTLNYLIEHLQHQKQEQRCKLSNLFNEFVNCSKLSP